MSVNAWIAVGCAVIVVTITALGYRRQWRWTGLPGDSGDKDTGRPAVPAKSLWDWMQLLVVPLVLAVAAFALNSAQAERDRRQQDRRAKDDRARAEDNTREQTLRDYLQQLSQLMLDKRLRTVDQGGSPNSTASKVARTLTLTTLRQLDGKRKGIVIGFLAEAELIQSEWLLVRALDPSSTPKPSRATVAPRSVQIAPLDREHLQPIVSLRGADLTGLVLRGTIGSPLAPELRPHGPRIVYGLDLSDTDLQGANLEGATIIAKFDGANLSRANLRRTRLSHSRMAGVCLTGAHLNHAWVADDLSTASFLMTGPELMAVDLSGAAGKGIDLSHAHMDGVDLSEAKLTDMNLRGASTRSVAFPPAPTPNGTRDALHGVDACRR